MFVCLITKIPRSEKKTKFMFYKANLGVKHTRYNITDTCSK